MIFKKPEINAGSMADIAFLLLIFFLVTTTIINDKGIAVLLPPFSENEEFTKIADRNVLEILVNSKNNILVENKPMHINALGDFIYQFVNNFEGKADFPESSDKAVVSISNSKSSSYETYIAVHNEIKAAYNKMWNELANQKYRSDFYKLKKAEQKIIRKIYPYKISEAESEIN